MSNRRLVSVILAAASGLLLVFSFPRVGHPLVAWVALAPLLLAVVRARSVAAAFGFGLLAGAVFFAGTVYWIAAVMADYGGLPSLMAWGVHLLLVAYLALFPALFTAGAWLTYRRFGALGLYCAPALWVTTELGRIYLFTGFPWVLLGYSQTPVLPVAQLASLVGVLGLSLLVTLVNASVVYVVTVKDHRRWLALGVTAALLLAITVFGGLRLHASPLLERGTPLRVAALQGNIAQDEKWNPTQSDRILRTYLDLTRSAAAAGARLIVWPEAATPFPFEGDPARAASIRAVARDTRTHLLLGTTDVTFNGVPRYYNAAVMVDDEGATVGTYHKQHLVPFGEYVPLRQALFFVSPLVETVGDFSAGAGPRTLAFDDGLVSAAICYEIIYPGLVREFVVRGSQLLTTITNDAWYGQSAAPYQHFQQATMRAIEQGRFLVRAANTGISGVVDPYGRVVARTPLFEEQMLTADVRLLEERTVYSRTGDALAYACVGMVILVLGLSLRHR